MPAASPILLTDADWLAIEREACERMFTEFVRQAWHVVEPGVPFIPSWHIDAICEHLVAVTNGQIRRLLINIPPRHAKSTMMVMWTVWEWIQRPQEKYLCASYSGALSLRDNLKARRLIESNWFQRLWGDKFVLTSDQNQKGRFENDHTGYRIATSVGGTATGEGGTRLILDDPHSAQEAQSEVIRESDLEWFKTVWVSRMNNAKRDAMITIMQRLHEADISGHILNDIGGWEHICIPAEYDGIRRKTVLGYYDPRKVKDELICPARFGPDELAVLKKGLGTYGTAGQLQQDPTPDDGGILKTSHFKLWPADKRLPQIEYVLQSYDCAFTEDTLGDPTACTVYGVFTLNKVRQVMLLDAWDELLGYPQMRKKVLDDWNAEYGGSAPGPGQPIRPVKPSLVLVEKKASGQSLLQDLRLAKVPAASYDPGKADKVSRAHQAAPTLELGIVWIPESTAIPGQAAKWAKPFVDQLRKFPAAKHDDYVDTFTQAIIYLKNAGWFTLPAAKDREEPLVRAPDAVRINPYAV